MSEAYSPYSQPASISSRSPSRRVSRVLVVVQDAAVGAAAHDRVVRDVGLVPMEFVQQLGHHLVLGDPGPGLLHRADVRADGDLRRALHHGRLGPALEQPHVVQRVLERDELLRAVDAVLGLAAQRVHPADDALVEIVVHAHRVVDPLAALEQARAGCRRCRRSGRHRRRRNHARHPRARRDGRPRFRASGSRSRTNSMYSACSRPGISTATASGSLKPVR